MKKINKHIEIVRSLTSSLSSMGQESCDMIQSVLEKRYARVGITYVNDTRDLQLLIAKQPDLVFLGVKNLPLGEGDESGAENVWLSAYLDERDINYTGSTATAIALDFNKPIAKQVVKAAGLNTSSHFMVGIGQYKCAGELPLKFPLFIKPPNTGGGKGVGADSVVRDFVAFDQKIKAIYDEFESDSLVEAYLPGREFSVAILETIGSDELIAMPIELITEQNASGDRILGQKVKADDTEHTVAVTDLVIKAQIIELATKAFRALGARDYGRIDIRLDETGTPHFLEANLIPGLAFHEFTSYFTTACFINRNMDYETMILTIVELGLTRNYAVEQSVIGQIVDQTIFPAAFEPALEIA